MNSPNVGTALVVLAVVGVLVGVVVAPVATGVVLLVGTALWSAYEVGREDGKGKP